MSDVSGERIWRDRAALAPNGGSPAAWRQKLAQIDFVAFMASRSASLSSAFWPSSGGPSSLAVLPFYRQPPRPASVWSIRLARGPAGFLGPLRHRDLLWRNGPAPMAWPGHRCRPRACSLFRPGRAGSLDA